MRNRRLTTRQQQILRLVANGHSNKAIGHALSIEPTTVQRHLHTIYRKLGAADRANAVAIALAIQELNLRTIKIPADHQENAT